MLHTIPHQHGPKAAHIKVGVEHAAAADRQSARSSQRTRRKREMSVVRRPYASINPHKDV